MFKPIILAGGKGLRLWPLSRNSRPKAFVKLLYLCGKNSLLQNTILRFSKLNHFNPLVICNNQQSGLVISQLEKINSPAEILLEAVGKNTAPAVALSALHAIKNNENPVLLILPADHIIQNVTVFTNTVRNAVELAKDDHIVAFGCVSKFASTAYGYINQGEKYINRRIDGQVNQLDIFEINQFVEKPDKLTAKNYLECGQYYWNSGIYAFKASRILKEFENYQPEILKICKSSLDGAKNFSGIIEIDPASFGQCPAISFDHAIMEPLCQFQNAKSALVIPIDVGWSDIGTWRSLAQAYISLISAKVLSKETVHLNPSSK